MWFRERSGLITASNFKAACRTSVQTPSLSLLKTICYPTQFLFKTKATMWGINHEKDALSAFVKYATPHHEGLRLEKVGLCVSPQYVQFGATPDAMVICDCCGTGCVEVKCPFLLSNMTMEQFINLKNCCLSATTGNVVVKQDRSYYYQMQMQMAITQTKYCEFVVWEPSDSIFLRIKFDQEFWNVNSSKAAASQTSYYARIIVPVFHKGTVFGRNLVRVWIHG